MELTDDSEKWIKHYSSRHKILVVGEGDFSFAASLARAFGNASNLPGFRSLFGNKASECGSQRGFTCVMHGVDASTMSSHYLLSRAKFDRIVFNFPHAGFFIKEHNSYHPQNGVSIFGEEAGFVLIQKAYSYNWDYPGYANKQ